MGNYEDAVFISYAWGGESERLVNELEQVLVAEGIPVKRDKKTLDYKGSIEAFEQRLGQGQSIVLVISDQYLHSEHCMFELVEIDKNLNLRERVFPIVLADAHIFKAVDRLDYIMHWDKQIEQLNQKIKQVNTMANLSGITADLDKYAQIRTNFDHLVDLLSDMNVLTPEIHEKSGFSTLIDAIERVRIKRHLDSSVSEITPIDDFSDETQQQLHVFNLLDADWSRFVRQISYFKQDYNNKIIMAFTDIENQLEKIMDAPHHPFYQAESWRDLCVLVKDFIKIEPSGSEKQLQSQVVENLILLLRRSAASIFGTLQGAKKKYLYELCVTMGDGDPSILSQFEKAKKEAREIEIAAKNYYEILQQSIRAKDWGLRNDMLVWFMENAPDHRDVLQLWSHYRGHRK